MTSLCTPESHVEMLNLIQDESERKWDLVERTFDLISLNLNSWYFFSTLNRKKNLKNYYYYV